MAIAPSLEWVVTIAANAAVVGASWASLQVRFSTHARQANARLLRIEKALGIENGKGEPGFMRRSECQLTEKLVEQRLQTAAEGLERIEGRLGGIEARLS